MTSRFEYDLNCHRHSCQSKRERCSLLFSLSILILFAIAPYLTAQSSQSTESLEHARALVAANHLAQANEILSILVSRDPHNLMAWEELGEVQLAQSLNDDAMKSFEAVLKVIPTSPKAQAGEVRAAIASALADRSYRACDRESFRRVPGALPRSEERPASALRARIQKLRCCGGCESRAHPLAAHRLATGAAARAR